MEPAEQMNELRRVDIVKEMGRHEGRPDQLALQHAIVLDHVARWHAGINQHFVALREALGARVLRRTFPEGWGLLRRGGMGTEEGERAIFSEVRTSDRPRTGVGKEGLSGRTLQ